MNETFFIFDKIMICWNLVNPVPNKIDFTAYSLHRDNPPISELPWMLEGIKVTTFLPVGIFTGVHDDFLNFDSFGEIYFYSLVVRSGS